MLIIKYIIVAAETGFSPQQDTNIFMFGQAGLVRHRRQHAVVE